jgi:cytochrome c biogenesis protein CcmG, thiol:disulfide interchange protein DsbE
VRKSVFRAFQVLALGLVAGLLVLLVWRVVVAGRGEHLVGDVRAGKKPPAPGFTLPILWLRAETWPKSARQALVDGKVSLRELKGHPVVINFWASWCIPCKHEAPRLADSARSHSGNVAFLGIDIQDFKGDARHFLRRFDTPYVAVNAGAGASGIYDDYGLTGVPETYWLDSRGRIVAHYPGEVDRNRIERGIRAAMAAK